MFVVPPSGGASLHLQVRFIFHAIDSDLSQHISLSRQALWTAAALRRFKSEIVAKASKAAA